MRTWGRSMIKIPTRVHLRTDRQYKGRGQMRKDRKEVKDVQGGLN